MVAPAFTLPAAQLETPAPEPDRRHYTPEGQAPLGTVLAPGRMIELSGEDSSAQTTTAVQLTVAAQRSGETTAWVQMARGPLFPPDLAASGVDLKGLVVLQIPASAGAIGPCRAAELLLRSGAYGFVAVDLRALQLTKAHTTWQTRLGGLAREHNATVVVLSHKSTQSESLGSFVGLRIESACEANPDGTFTLHHRLLKNKTGASLELASSHCKRPSV